jgi:hypothetical protein
MSDQEQYGEIIQADSQAVVAESHRLYHAPAFGSFVRVACEGSGRSFYVIVTGVSTGAFDGNRLVQAHRLPPGVLEERKPHLPSLLRTQFQGRIVGWGEGETRVPGTPPAPPRLHCWIYPAAPEEIRGVTRDPIFLRPLVDPQNGPLEDLLVAAIGTARDAWEGAAPVVAWGKYLARLLRGQYVVLESVLRRLGSAPPQVAAPRPVSTAANPDVPGWEMPLPVAGDAPPKTNGGAKYSSGQLDPFSD